jgi:hypothetical protein
VNIIAFFAKTIVKQFIFYEGMFYMLGKIIDMNNTDAFINFLDGTTMDVSNSRLPKNSKVGDTIDLNIGAPINMLNDKMVDFF